PERWLRGKEVRETVQGVVVHPHVCVEEDEYVAPTNFGSSVSSVRGPVWLAGEANHRVGMWRRYERCLVRASVVHDDELPAIARQIARDERGERLGKHACSVMGGDDHGQQRTRRAHVRLGTARKSGCSARFSALRCSVTTSATICSRVRTGCHPVKRDTLLTSGSRRCMSSKHSSYALP